MSTTSLVRVLIHSTYLKIEVGEQDKVSEFTKKIARAAGFGDEQQFDVYGNPADDGDIWVFAVRDNITALAFGDHKQVALFLNDSTVIQPHERVWPRVHERLADMVQLVVLPRDPVQAIPRTDAPNNAYVRLHDRGAHEDRTAMVPRDAFAHSNTAIAVKCSYAVLVFLLLTALWLEGFGIKIIVYALVAAVAATAIHFGVRAAWTKNPVVAAYLALLCIPSALLPVLVDVIFAKGYQLVIESAALATPLFVKANVDAISTVNART